MNQELTNSIAKHIFNNLGITDKRNISIITDAFLTNYIIEYLDETDEGVEYNTKTNVWIANGVVDNVSINIAYTKFNNQMNKEHCIIVNIENCPTYGVYIDCNEYATIAFSIKENIWVKSDIYFQATFLAGMESFKDLTVSFAALEKNTENIYDKLISFIKFYEDTI